MLWLSTQSGTEKGRFYSSSIYHHAKSGKGPRLPNLREEFDVFVFFRDVRLMSSSRNVLHHVLDKLTILYIISDMGDFLMRVKPILCVIP